MTGPGRPADDVPPAGTAVVAGIDGSPASTAVVDLAAAEAHARGLRLRLVHVVPWPTAGLRFTGYEDLWWESELRRRGTELLAAAAARAEGALPADRVDTSVGFGDPVAELVRYAAAAPLLVVGPRGTGGVTGLLIGSTATGVVAHAGCPVVVLPPDPGAAPAGRGPVVVGIAGAQEDDAVLSFATAEAALRGADLVAVHAWTDPFTEPGPRMHGLEVDWDGVAAQEARVLAEAVAGVREKEPGLAVEERVVRDRAAPALVDAARDAQLLVVGRAHGGPLHRLGSAGHAVLHRAACPVAVVPPPASAGRPA